MKRNLLLSMSMVLAILLSACSKENQQICYACNESCSESATFCPNCGVDLFLAPPKEAEEKEEEIVDYSTFGFQNNYGMTEWLWIRSYDFSDVNNAYVAVNYRDQQVLSLNSGYFQIYKFEKLDYLQRDLSKGEIDDVLGYDVVSNSLLKLEDNSTYEMREVVLEQGIPILETEHKLYQNQGTFLTDGSFIPADFIDFSREPEIVEAWYSASYHTYNIKYYIKAECLQELGQEN